MTKKFTITLTQNQIEDIIGCVEYCANHSVASGHMCHASMAGNTPHVNVIRINRNNIIKTLENQTK